MADENIQELHNSIAKLLDDDIPLGSQLYTDFCTSVRGYLTPAQLDKSKPSTIFKNLEISDGIRLGEYGILLKILNAANLKQLRVKVLAKVKEIKSRSNTSDKAGAASSSSISPSRGVQPLNTDTKQQIFKFITKSAACKDWRSLGRELRVSDPEIEAIAMDNFTSKEQCYQMLETWHKATGDTLVVLMDALRGIDCVRVAVEIKQRFDKDATE